MLSILSVEYGGMKYQEKNEIGCPGTARGNSMFPDISVANKLLFIDAWVGHRKCLCPLQT